MAVNRRSFLRSVAAGSSAYLVGCTDPGPALDGVPCPPLSPPAPSPDLDYPPPSYFSQLSMDLEAARLGTPVVFIDMDRVDQNIDAIARGTPPGGYRIVEKSLPSLDLLAYVSERSGSDKFMVLHLPFLGPLLAALPAAQVLVGKTHRTRAVEDFFESLPAGTDRASVAARVIFLADGPARLDELIGLAVQLGLTLRVAVELDVGLRRSGLADASELAPVLGAFLESSVVTFSGFLGYDGHVAFTPGATLAAVTAAWMRATDEYQAFVDVLSEPEFARLAGLPDLVFNSGGSSTYPMYTSGTPVNDVAVGGGVLRPGDYPDHVISALQPAIFIATPVLRRYEAPGLPFFSAAQSAGLFEGLAGLTIYGGGWPAFFTHPAGIRPAPFVSDATDPAMVPNQGMVTVPLGTDIGPGDWVYYHPRQSDALFQFERILKVRGGRLEADTFAAYPRRY